MPSIHLVPFVYDPAIQAIPLLLEVHVFTEVSCFDFVTCNVGFMFDSADIMKCSSWVRIWLLKIYQRHVDLGVRCMGIRNSVCGIFFQ